jgi:hypothetical protein
MGIALHAVDLFPILSSTLPDDVSLSKKESQKTCVMHSDSD